MRVLVTGGSGYVGSWLVRAFAARGDSVASLDVLPFPHLEVPVDALLGDVRDPTALRKACAGCDVVVHAAARVPLTKDHRGFHEVNVLGTRAVLTAARACRVRKVVHVSSSAVFGVPAEVPVSTATPRRPIDPYGDSKARAEEECERFRGAGLNVVILRPRTIVGPERLGIFQLLFERILRHRTVYLIGTGGNRLELVSIEDFCRACLLAVDRAESLTLGIGGRAFGTLREDLGALIRHAGSRSRVVGLPAAPTVGALRLLDVLRLSPLARWHYRTAGVDFFYDDAARARLGYDPRDANADVLAGAFDWYVHERPVGPAAGASPHRSNPSQGVFRLLGS